MVTRKEFLIGALLLLISSVTLYAQETVRGYQYTSCVENPHTDGGRLASARAGIAAVCEITGEDEWYGFQRIKFVFKGHNAWLVVPKVVPASGNPWTWTTQWGEAFVDRTGVLQLLESGFHHTTIDVFNERGNDAAIALMGEYQDFLVNSLGLEARTRLVGMSWGGFISVRYAATFPQNVARMYLDAPLLCFGPGFSGDMGPWAGECPENGWGSDPRMPLNLASVPAHAGIPVLLLYGGEDQTVNPKFNCIPFIARYRKEGGEIMVIERPLFGHHPHGEDPDKTSTIAQFLRTPETAGDR